MAKVGDIVRYLNAVGGGPIVRIDGQTAWVDDDGFETPVLLRECVVVRAAEDVALTDSHNKTKDASRTAVAPKTVTQPAPTKALDPDPVTTGDDDEEEIEETPDGDKLNIVLGFEPTERTRLSETDFDASLINDSNYYLYFALASRDSDSTDWTTRYAGIVEPNTELWIGTFSRLDIASFDNLCFQYIAFKRNREYGLKQPASVELKVDTTKFFKLHCFRPNTYFDGDVLAFDLVTDDVPYSPEPVKIDLPQRLTNLESHTGRTKRYTKFKNKQRVKEPVNLNEPLVVDLHINELLDNTRGMSAADILNYQIEVFQRTMDSNLRNFGRRIIFIHGKGEGVLRHAIDKELTHRYRGHDVCDASFREYGYGATQVTIRQHPDAFRSDNNNSKHR